MPKVVGEIERSFAGCYSSLVRVKNDHRRLEQLLLAVERQAALSWWQGSSEHPTADLDVAWRDCLFAKFHDILPGSCIPQAETDSLRGLAHGEEILRRLRLRLLLQAVRHQAPAADGAVPLFVVNDQGRTYEGPVELEWTPHHLRTPTKGALVTIRDVRGRVI